MKLCLDVGNSHIYGGVYESGRAPLTFRKASKTGSSSDEYGLFFRSVLRENGVDPNQVSEIALCSVVPEAVYAISAACQKYFDIRPFILQAGVKTGLKIQYRNPLEVGADRIANAIAGIELFPGENLIIVDLGTATTLCAVGKDRSYKTTAASIQSGLYFGHLGALQEIMNRIQLEEFGGQRPKVIATGGFASLFDRADLFDQVVQDLVLRGLLAVLELNTEKQVA